MAASDPAAGISDKMSYFGCHDNITCDGCCVVPIQGFRYKCTRCSNHDLCEACYSQFAAGELIQHKNMMSINKMSQKFEDHDFKLHKTKNFKGIKAASDGPVLATAKSDKKTKPNEPCPCLSGKKYKKCCGK